MRIAPAGYVAARALAGNQALACRQARHKFMAEFLHGIALTLRKVGDALVRKADIAFDAIAQRLVGPRKVLRPQHDRPVPAVQGAGVFAYPLLATGADSGQHGLHRGGGVAVMALRAVLGGFEVFNSHGGLVADGCAP